MAAAIHSQFLPVVALDLVLQVDRYRRAIAEVARRPHEEAAREAALFALRTAGPLAFAVPSVWTSWGPMFLRHAEFMQEWMNGATLPDLQRSWRRVDDSAEIVTQRCIEWALRRQKQHPVAPGVAAAFLSWDQARREAFELARQVAAIHEESALGATVPVPRELQQRYEAAVRDATRLLGKAMAALKDGGADAQGETMRAPPGNLPGGARGDDLDYARLHERWRVAEEAATDAELALVEMQLTGVLVAPAQQDFAQALRARARECREAVFQARLL
jgi:hypothetical protein